MASKQGLSDLRVVLFENRLATTLADLVRLQGGTPFIAPCMKEVPLDENPEAFLFAENLLRNQVDLIIFLTGVGTKTLLAILETRYDKNEILEALRNTTVVPRGPKPIRVLKEWNVPYALTVPEPNTWRELVACLDEHKDQIPLQGKRVVVQEYGVSNPSLVYELQKRGAIVQSVPIYKWTLPDNIAPMKQAIQESVEGRFQVALFTTAVQADHLFKVAKIMNLESELRASMRRMVIASVGPDCAEAILANGLDVDIQPESPKMGPLVQETAMKAKEILKKKSKENSATENCAIELRGAILELAKEPDLHESIFLKACRREKTSYTPIWLMRQAGRYMKEYRKIRDKQSFLEVCKDKDLVTEITVTAQEKIGADAAIIFADILLLVEAMGLGLEYLKGDGPSIKKKVRTLEDVENIPSVDAKETLRFVLEAIVQTRKCLKPGIPLIGFAGAPFTLASYMIEGGPSKDFATTKALMRDQSKLWPRLMEKIARMTGDYLNAQIESGVQAIQLFDSWVGCLSPQEYETHVLPYSKMVFDGLKNGIPAIHFGTGTGKFLKSFSSAGANVVSVDHEITLDKAWKEIGYEKAIQGNLDPKILCGEVKTIQKHVERILKEAGGRAGHIFNLGHGVLPETPVENVIALVQMVHELSAK